MFRLLEWFFYDVLHLRHYPDRPCPHLKDRLSDLCDNTAKGLSRWYTERHVRGCPGCSNTLRGLRLVRSRLLRLDNAEKSARAEKTDTRLNLSPERRQAVVQSWEQTDEKLAANPDKFPG